MRLRSSIYAFLAALVLLDGSQAADPEWRPIELTIDPISPVVRWMETWETSFGGVTNPQPGQVGWGPSQRVLDASKLPRGNHGDDGAAGFRLGEGYYSNVRVYGDRRPEPPDGAAIFTALVNSTVQPSWIRAPGANGSAISVDLPPNVTYVSFMPSSAQGVYTVNSFVVSRLIKTNYTSVDMIPRVTEFLVQNGTLNPRLQWTNDTFNSSHVWEVRKGISDLEVVTATQPTAGAAATGGVTPPAKDSGVEDYYQVVSSSGSNKCTIPIPEGTSLVIINGTTGLHRSYLTAEFMPLAPNSKEGSGADFTNNASNPWAADTILYMRELDPTVRYSLTLSNGGSDGSTIGIHSITYYYGLADAGTGGTDTGKSHTAAIAGGVVGGVVGGLLVALVALYFCVWKPRKRREWEEAEREARLENAGFTPYVQREVDGGTLTVPPSYDPAWGGETSGSSSRSTDHPGSDSTTPLLLAGGEKQRQAAAVAAAAVQSATTPITANLKTPDWKVPYLPQQAGGAALGGTPETDARGSRGIFGKRRSHEKTMSPNSEKSGQSGYSEGMLRAINPDD